MSEGPVNFGNFPPNQSNVYANDQKRYEEYSSTVGKVSPGTLTSITRLATTPEVPQLPQLMGLNQITRWSMVEPPAEFRDQTNMNMLARLGNCETLSKIVLPHVESLINNSTNPQEKETLLSVRDMIVYNAIPYTKMLESALALRQQLLQG